MRLYSYLYKNRFGIYYLRLQKNGVDRRISLKTRDPDIARHYSYKLGTSIAESNMNNKISTWGLELTNGSLKITDVKSSEEVEQIKALVDELSQNDQLLAAIGLPVETKKTPTLSLEEVQKEILTKLSPIKPQKMLSEAITEFNAHQWLHNAKEKSSEKYEAKSIKGDEKVFRELLKAIGDVPLANLDEMVLFRKWQEPRLKDVSDQTVKKEISSIHKLFRFCEASGRQYMHHKVRLNQVVREKNVEHWDYLDEEDMILIVNNLPKLKMAWKFWIILVAMYTGARAGEIGQLRVADFKTVKGVQSVFIEGTKTAASIRTIPVHPTLIELGLMDYVQHRRDKGYERIFPGTGEGDNGWGARPSRVFSDFKTNIGLKGKKKVLHSFRETICDLLKQAEVNIEKRCEYVGHETENSVHSRTYTRRRLNQVKMKERVVDMIVWDLYYENFTMDIEGLKTVAKTLLLTAK